MTTSVPAAVSAAVPGAVLAGVRAAPTGPAYSVLLLLHVAAAVIGFGALAVTGIQAARLRTGWGGAGSPSVRRYFRPGVNWPGRALYAVPVFGFSLLADSGGAFGAGDGWVEAGLVLWLVAAGVAEIVVWPGERRIQRLVTEQPDDPGTARSLDRECRRVLAGAGLLTGVFLAATVIMVAKP